MSRSYLVVGLLFEAASQAVLASQADFDTVAVAASAIAVSSLPTAYGLAHRVFRRLTDPATADF